MDSQVWKPSRGLQNVEKTVFMSKLLNSTGSSGYYAPWHENILSWTKNQFYGFADSF